ncbi:MAG: hydroxypyruvate isomerase [Rhodospirillales bacterium CG15_BIG_FIL_POST_REV_8_21_14_020_66_15]|nr:MAG: hydroxypyruvate isomerase [Rhodospirillales bacterium CG15_BIG_FIL_POST_REV_8_21_14_020_66_15]
MPRFAANIGWLAQEVPMLERFRLVRDLGFTAVECPLLYGHDADALAEACKEAALEFLMFNSPPGKHEGEYGIAGLKGRKGEFQDTIARAIRYAKALDTTYLHVLAGWQLGDWDRKAAFGVFIDNLKWACPVLAEAGLTALIEPINTHARPGYLVQTTWEAQRVVDTVKAAGHKNIGIQYDFHNAQIMEGDLARTFEAHLPSILHVQIAGNPGRTPPDEGEIAYPFVFDLVDRLGYTGWIGCEYTPHDKSKPGATKASLKWAEAYGLG